jgi:hypothetical protein
MHPNASKHSSLPATGWWLADLVADLLGALPGAGGQVLALLLPALLDGLGGADDPARASRTTGKPAETDQH